MKKATMIMALVLAVVLVSNTAFAGEILDKIKSRGKIRCGIYEDVPGLATLNNQGRWQGFDVDYCRATAAALFGDGEKVEFTKMAFAQGMPAVKSGEVDMANLAITDTIGRECYQGFDFVGPTLYSGMAFMVHKRTGAKKIEDLDGATICVVAGGVTDSLIADYFKARGMTYTPVAFENTNQRYQFYEEGRCDVVTSEIPFLAIRRARLKNPEEHLILPEIFSKSDMGPVILEDDVQWSNIAKAVHWALVTADEYGISSENIDEVLKTTKDPAKRRFLGVDENIGKEMGLSNDFTVSIIKAVGNYNEIWERNFGMKSAMKLPRGLNELATKGGLQWAPTWR